MRAEGRFTARNAALASAAQQSGGASRTVVMGPDGESLQAHPSSAEHWTDASREVWRLQTTTKRPLDLVASRRLRS